MDSGHISHILLIHSMLTNFIGPHLTQQPDCILKLNICDISLGLPFWCIRYLLILNITPSKTTSEISSWRYDMKDKEL